MTDFFGEKLMSTLQRSGAPQAIQTRYKGWHFRSRLEARFAVFFDSIGIKWEYEKQGYDLRESYSVGGHKPGLYLPDFWLPTQNAWLEVKGCLQQDHFLTSFEEAQMVALVRETEVQRGYVFYGQIDHDIKMSIIYRYMDGSTDIQREFGLWVFQDNDADIDDAIEAARSARFEHGESGRT